ncbi:hypothetical protein [Paenibacillus sp.]|uniref:YphA family membrane protein n=1 Tax=Paenibacillus sp. TaxID=58172 RepID=UPI0028125897|nr:hypothetical protein [Paenibacillus sp.]
MNPGFLSYILLTLSLILICFGWRSHAIGGASARAASLFCLGWIAAAAVDWKAGAWAGTAAYAPLLALAALGLVSPFSRKDAAAALSFGCLLGAIFSLVQLVERVDPLAIVLHPTVDPVALIALLVVCYTRRAAAQLAMLSIALVVNDAYMALLYARWQPPFFGGREFQDAWWVAAASARVLSVASAAVVDRAKREGGRIWAWLRVRR